MSSCSLPAVFMNHSLPLLVFLSCLSNVCVFFLLFSSSLQDNLIHAPNPLRPFSFTVSFLSGKLFLVILLLASLSLLVTRCSFVCLQCPLSPPSHPFLPYLSLCVWETNLPTVVVLDSCRICQISAMFVVSGGPRAFSLLMHWYVKTENVCVCVYTHLRLSACACVCHNNTTLFMCVYLIEKDCSLCLCVYVHMLAFKHL